MDVKRTLRVALGVLIGVGAQVKAAEAGKTVTPDGSSESDEAARQSFEMRDLSRDLLDDDRPG